MKNNQALKVLMLSNAVFLFALSLLGPLYTVYAEKISGGVLAVSISMGVFYVSTALFLLIMSRIGDKYRHKEWLLAASHIVRGFGFIGYIFIGNVLQLVLLQVIFGLGAAIGTPSFGALFAKHVDRKEEVMEYSDWALISHLVSALGTVVGGFMVSVLGFNFLFVVSSLLCFVSAGWILLTPRKIL